MKTIPEAIVLSVLVLIATSCNAFTPKPTETPIPTVTSLPTLTFTPKSTLTPTLPPTETPIPSTNTPSVPVLHMPLGTPVANWDGIPVMPTAIAGEDRGNIYTFTVTASLDVVQKFYENKMPKIGWKMFAKGQGTTKAILLMFMKGTDLITISLIPQPNDVIYVMLVK